MLKLKINHENNTSDIRVSTTIMLWHRILEISHAARKITAVGENRA